MKDKTSIKNKGQQARARLQAEGRSVASVAEAMQCSRSLVDRVLNGELLCHMGKSHEVAVKLGMKAGSAKAASYRVTPQREAA